MTRARRIELFIFCAAFFAFAWFHQGGGWNQNSRFAEVRAMAEQGRFAIDSHLLYGKGRPRADGFERIPVENGDFTQNGKRHRLAWNDENWNLTPVRPIEPGDEATPVPLAKIAMSGDVSFAQGHFHPNKPPGTSFLALPAYFVLFHIERLTGLNPDHWCVLTINAWLTTTFSVGLISAFGCVIFFRVAKIFAGRNSQPALLATITFAFGTMFFPFATILFDHNLTATALLASFYLILSAKAECRMQNPEAKQRCCLPPAFLSGLCAGIAAITNYVASVAVVLLGLYLLDCARGRSIRQLRSSLFAFALGLLGPFALICIYNQSCYGSPFALCNDFQNPVFADTGHKFLGMFSLPNPLVAVALLVSPFRGIFFSAPVLLMGVYGWMRMRRNESLRAEAWLIAAMCGLFFFVNITFSGWHGGYTIAPRYLIPALPFLALPLVFGFERFPKITRSLAAISIAINLLFTAVDAGSKLGVGYYARVEGRLDWFYNQITEYALPLFVYGRNWPILDQLIAASLKEHGDRFAAIGLDAAARSHRLALLHTKLVGTVKRGEKEPFPLAAFAGPVSVNPTGVYEGECFQLFGPHTAEARWNSFNAGELILHHSRWSLAPLLLVSGTLLALSFRCAGETSGSASGGSG